MFVAASLSNGPPEKEVWDKLEVATPEVVVFDEPVIADEAFEIVTNAFGMLSEQFEEDIFEDFNLVELNIGAGRAGCGCNIAIDDTPDADEVGGIICSSWPWCRKFILACNNTF